jgi:uncharacterized protein YecT (DUF1311 family)
MRAPLLLAALLLAGTATPALAFDCTKARSPVEKAICADPALTRADTAMAQAYVAIQTGMSQAEGKALLHSQRDWLKQRDGQCGGWGQPGAKIDGACLLRESDARRRLLAGEADDAGPGALPLRPAFSEQVDAGRKIDVSIALPRLGEGATAPGLEALLQATANGSNQRVGDDPSYSYDATYAIASNSRDLVSVVFDIRVDHGGAHGISLQATANYSPALGRALTIDDLVDGKGIGALTNLCRDQLRRERLTRGATADTVDDELTEAAVADGIRSITAWQFHRESVAIHYDPYAIGSFAEGSYDCTIPWPVLRKAARSGAPLPRG